MLQTSVSHRRLGVILKVLLLMIVGLMALGAGVRTMNAGLSCPDWPLCFGEVIPDFHPAVWFEFVHRAYAGLVAIVFACALVISFRTQDVPRATKMVGVLGAVFLTLQIVAGGLTVLLRIKAGVVTMHLMLATCFFLSVLWMWFSLAPAVKIPEIKLPRQMAALVLLPVLVFLQIFVGGLVASTYAGSVCVDWPLCNGQWVPTWSGAIGLQVFHRFFAYALALIIPTVAILFWRSRNSRWMTAQLFGLARLAAVIVLVQVAVGIANLMLFIPPALTVLHQSVAIALLAVCTRKWFVVRHILKAQASAPEESPVASRGPLAETPSSLPQSL